jgi:RNA-directed DNA polymerase
MNILEINKNQDMRQFYTSFNIPKQSGGMRQINAPITIIKEHMSRMLETLQNFGIWPHNAAYAYVIHRCTRDAIAVHQKTNNEWFIKIDLHDFFGSCNQGFITQQLLKIPFFRCMPTDVLQNFVHFCSYGDKLPQGSPLSPFITNQIMVEYDYRLTQAAKMHHLTYTRYADDMLFSGNSKNAVKHAIDMVETILYETPLKINTDKTRIGSIYGQNWNLGIMLNKDHNITIGHKKKERLRASIHNFIMNPQEWHYQECTELLGLIQYFRTIEPDYVDQLLTKYSQKYNIDIRSALISKIKQGASA